MDIKKIDQIRRLKKLSITALCKKAGISETGYHRMISKNNITLVSLESLCRALGVSPAILWGENIDSDTLKCTDLADKCRKLEKEVDQLSEDRRSLTTAIDNLNKYIVQLQGKN